MNGLVLERETGMDATALARRLADDGIETRPFFLGMHRQPFLLERGLFAGEVYPVADELADQGLYLPSGVGLRDDEIADGPHGDGGRAGMTDVFGHEYAEAYDLLYADKDYDAECDLLERIFRESGRPVRTVLDLGCGTGAHAVRLAQRGYSVVGVDLSAEMLAACPRARRVDIEPTSNSCWATSVRSTLIAPSMRSICMFAVLGYQTTDADVADTLVHRAEASGSRRHHSCSTSGTGPQSRRSGPEQRVKVIPTPTARSNGRRRHRSRRTRHLCTVSYRISWRREGLANRVTDEVHRMRYFFVDELQTSLNRSGLSLADVKPFPEGTGEPSISSWNVLATVRG